MINNLNKYLKRNEQMVSKKTAKVPDITKISDSVMDWAFDMLEVIEASVTPADIKTAKLAVDNLQKSLKNVEIKKNMVEKISSRFK